MLRDALLRGLLDAAPDAMVVVDASGCVVHVNTRAEELFAYRREELLGQPVEILIPIRYRAAHPGHRRMYFDQRRVRPMGAGGIALFGLRRDGTEFPAEISLSPLDTSDGPLAITAIRDVTERKRAEHERERLVQAQEAIRLRDEFLSIASHELRTPLSALSMQIDGIRYMNALNASPRDQEYKPKIDRLHEAIGRLTALVNQLLDFSRITAGRLQLEVDDADLSAVVRSVAARFHDELDRVGCTLKLHANDPIVGRWDLLRIEQVVANLLSNALKYGSGKPVEVATRLVDAAAVLTVRDHGIGIAPIDQARIFERFERVVPERSFGGFGLGLWIVRQVVEAHGGTIRVWSELGAGATFTVELPIEGRIRADQPRDADATAEALPIMIVDDDAGIRDSFADVLSEAGYPVVTAANGQDALKILRSGVRPCVILLDLMMPVMDGATFRAEQQRVPALATIPTVVMSASSDATAQASALATQGCLPKPVTLAALLAVVQQFRG